MIIKLETLLENGIIDPNKITELVCDGKTVYKGYSDDIASFGKDYEFIKFNNTVNESFNTPAYTIEVKAKHPVNESFTSQFGLKTKADVIKSMKYFDYYDDDKKDALLEEIDYLCDLYNIDEGFDFVLDDELNNYVDIDILTEKLTRYNVDRKLDNMAAKTARKNFTTVYAVAGTFMGWFFAGIIGGVIGHFIGISICKNNHRARITELYNFMKNDSQCIQITNHIKQILKNDKLDKEDKTQLKELRKQFANRIKELRGQYNWSANSVKKALAESTEVLSENKQQVLKDNVEKEPENTKTVTIDRSKNEFGQWKSYDAYKANEKKEADEARAGVLRNEKKKEEYFAKHPKAPDPNTYWDAKNKCLRDKDTNEVVKKTKYSPASLREDVEQIDEEVLDRILLEMPLINTDKINKKDPKKSKDFKEDKHRTIIYGTDNETEMQLKNNAKKINKNVAASSKSAYISEPKKEDKKKSTSNWKYVTDIEAEVYKRKAEDAGATVSRMEADKDDVKKLLSKGNHKTTPRKGDGDFSQNVDDRIFGTEADADDGPVVVAKEKRRERKELKRMQKEYKNKTLKEDIEQIDEEVLDRILLEMPLINTDKIDKGRNSDDLVDYPGSRKIIYGKDKKTEKQLKKNVDKFNGKMVRDGGATILSRTKIYNFSKKESSKNAPISNWKYVSDKDAEKYARKVIRSNVGIKRLEVDEDDVKRITDNDYARVKHSKRDFTKDTPNTDKNYTDELEARLKKAKEDVNKEEKKDKK